MPIHQGYTTRDGKRYGYYAWGNRKKYLYLPGNEKQREKAKNQAIEQMKAIYARGYKAK